jgi:LCP family protein required for cell wall assembly
LGNYISRINLERWRSWFFGRPVGKNYWSGTSMARPAVRQAWLNHPAGRPISGALPTRRPARQFQPNLVVILTGAFALLLVAIIVMGLILIFQGPGEAAAAPAAVSQPKTNQNPIVTGQLPSGQTKILLLGSDQRPNDPGYRTDVIMLVTIDTGSMTVSVVSFPRDLWVKVPSLYEMKINQVQVLGGFDAMAEMFQANFGVKPDYYVLTTFTGFTSFFDKQGGVDVEVAQELTDECSLPQAVNSSCTVKPGTVHMNGATALWYVRSRHSSSDFDRLRRAQEVVYAMFKKLVTNISLDKLSEIKTALENSVETNLSFDKAVSFLPVATHLLQAPEQIKRFAIDEKQSTPSWSWNGMWILLPDTEAIQGVLREAGVKP